MKTIKINRVLAQTPCPICGEFSKKHSTAIRTLKHLSYEQKTIFKVTYSRHFCNNCMKHFTINMWDLAAPKSHYTNSVFYRARQLRKAGNLTFEKVSSILLDKYHVDVPVSTICDWEKEF